MMTPGDSGAVRPAGLSGRQAAFARFVALGHAPSQAAVLAGYGATSAARQGWRLMGQPEIAARVDALKASAAALRRAPVDRVRGELNARFSAAIAAGKLSEAMRLAKVSEDLFLRGGLKPPVPARYGMDKNDDARREAARHRPLTPTLSPAYGGEGGEARHRDRWRGARNEVAPE